MNILYLLIFSMTALQATRYEEYGKTAISLPSCDQSLGKELSLWHTHTTIDLGNPKGFSVQMSPFLTVDTSSSRLAQLLTTNGTQKISIASDRFLQHGESVLPYHATQHNPALDAEEETVSVQLTPSFTQAGITLSGFYDCSENVPGMSITCSLPLLATTATLQTKNDSFLVDRYFSGAYTQTVPLQEALQYGKHTSKTHYSAGPFSIQCTYNLIETESQSFGLSVGGGINFDKNNDQTQLFSPHIRNQSHKLFMGCEGITTLYKTSDITAELFLLSRYSYFFPHYEKRIIGLLEDDGSAPAFSYYLLGAEKGVKGVFPLTNVLHQEVDCAGNHELCATIMCAFSSKNLVYNVGYELFARRKEAINTTQWDADTYAIVYPTYDTTHTFANSATTATLQDVDILLNHRFITQDMLNTAVTQSEAHAGWGLFASAGYNMQIQEYPFLIGAGCAYQHGITLATPSHFSIWGKIGFSC